MSAPVPELQPRPASPSHGRRRLRRVGLALAAIVGVLAVGGLTAVELRWTRTFEAPYPALAASADPALVADGEYLVYSAAACAYCHVPREQWDVLDRGEQLPLTGHHLFRLRPFGDIYSANLTPDPATGIGRRTDAELARVLRYGVLADGRAAFPLMEYHDLSDHDVVAVIAYLRSRPAVAHAVPEHRFTRLGKAIMGFALTPTGPGDGAGSGQPGGPVAGARRLPRPHRVGVCELPHRPWRGRGAGRAAVRRRATHGHRGLYYPGVRHPEPDTGCVEQSDRSVDRGRIPQAIPTGPARQRHADAVGRLRPAPRRRPAQPLSLSAVAAAGDQPHRAGCAAAHLMAESRLKAELKLCPTYNSSALRRRTSGRFDSRRAALQSRLKAS